MDFKLAEDKKNWNDFVAGQSSAQFLQSWEWGEFQKAYGRRLWRLGSFKDAKQVGAAQIIEHYLGLGMGYLFCPRGPIGQIPIEELVEFIKGKIANYGDIFLRMEPENLKINGRRLTINRVEAVHPAHTLLLDLSRSEEKLLAEMHSKTRYNIRLAEKRNLKFGILNLESEEQKHFDEFWRLIQETSKRDHIKSHPKKYYGLMFKILSKTNNGFKFLIFNIRYSDFLLCAGIFIGFGDIFTYVHGASINKFREMMASHLLQWEAIKFAKRSGYKYYDLGGVNPLDEKDFAFRQSWEGITRFKRGFGGEVLRYAGTFETPLKEREYKIFRSMKIIKRII